MRAIKTYGSLPDAQLDKTRLSDAGVVSVVAGEQTGTIGYGGMFNEIRLEVADEDFESAAKILATIPKPMPADAIMENSQPEASSEKSMHPNPPPVPDVIPTSSDEKIWIILCHLSLILGVGFLLPLIVYFVKRQDSPGTAQHAREALNFHISVYLYAIISFLLIFVLIGIPLLVFVGIGSVICAIIACVKASEGSFYRYPLTIRLV